jgi:hypothetical protein
MATAEKISFVESPRVLLQLVEKSSPVAGVSTEEGSVSARRSSKGQMTSQAPRLIVQPVNNNTPSSDYVDILIAYMSSVLNLSVKLANAQAQISQMQTANSQGFVVGAKAAAEKAVQDLEAAIEAAEKQSHESKWQQILGYVGAGLMAAIALITVQPELFLMATLMTVDMMTGLSDKLNDAIANSMSNVPSWLKPELTIITKVAIALAMAAVVGGLSGLARAAAEKAIGAAVAEGAAAAGAAADAGAANVAAAVRNDESFLDSVIKNGFKNGKGPAGYGQLLSTTVQMTMIVNPFTDMFQSMLSAIPSSVLGDATKKLLAKIFGSITALLMMLAAGKFSGVAGEANYVDIFAQKMGQAGFNTLKYSTYALLSLSTMAQGVLGIYIGQAMAAQSDATKDLGIAQSLQIIYSGLTTQINQLIQQSQAASKAVNDTIASINERWDSYVEPYRLSADIAG